MKEVNNIKELREKQVKELDNFVNNCPHTSVKVEQGHSNGVDSITIRCTRCELNLLGFSTDGRGSCLDYVRDCCKDYKARDKHLEETR